jgi:hypothetical protein
MWAEHGVRKWALAEYRMHHPVVGRMELNLQSLNVPQDEGQRIVVATAGADTASAAALSLLARVDTPTVPRTDPAEVAETVERRPTVTNSPR